MGNYQLLTIFFSTEWFIPICYFYSYSQHQSHEALLMLLNKMSSNKALIVLLNRMYSNKALIMLLNKMCSNEALIILLNKMCSNEALINASKQDV